MDGVNGLLHASSYRSIADIHLESRFLPTPLAFNAPVRNIAVAFGTGKTRMVWLPDGEKILKIC